jgi:hypothetical protein
MVLPAQISGQRFGRLVAICKTQRPASISDTAAYWLFRCDCGTERVIRAKDVRTGKTQSCGCYHAEIAAQRKLKHGHTRRLGDKRAHSPEYLVWNGMWARCTNRSSVGYAKYGARGITVCERWRDFGAFYADMGPRPSSDHSIDRIDNDGHYEPSNCRWATKEQQSNNQRRIERFTVRGVTGSLSQLARKFGVPGGIARQRIAKFGWTVEDAVTTPPRRRGARGAPNRNAASNP